MTLTSNKRFLTNQSAGLGQVTNVTNQKLVTGVSFVLEDQDKNHYMSKTTYLPIRMQGLSCDLCDQSEGNKWC